MDKFYKSSKFRLLFACFLLYLFLTFVFYLVIDLISSKRKPEIFQVQQQKYEFILMGSSTYIFNGGGRVFGNYYVQQELQRRGFSCPASFFTFNQADYEADNYRIWGYRGEKGINQATVIQRTVSYIDQAKDRGSQPVVLIAYGANESKDIKAGQSWASMSIFRDYLTAAVNLFKNRGAIVLVGNPIKGCPTLPSKNYDVEGLLKQLSNNIISWFSGNSTVVNIYGAFENNQGQCMSVPGYSLYNTECALGACPTECLINLPPYYGPDPTFPERGCTTDYCHPNQPGYELLAEKVITAFLSLDPCVLPSPSPSRLPVASPSRSPSPSPSSQAVPSPSVSASPGFVPSPSLSPSPSFNPSPSISLSPSTVPLSPSPSPSPVAPPGPTETLIGIDLKFIGVPANDNNLNLLPAFYQKEIRVYLQDNLGNNYFISANNGWQQFTYNSESKSYKAYLRFNTDNLPSGNYIFLIKGSSHRQTRFCKNNQSLEETCPRKDTIFISSGGNTYEFNFTGNPLDFGDVNTDGAIGVSDYSLVKSCLQFDARVNSDVYDAGCSNADGNFDGVVDNTDMDLIIQSLLEKTDDD